MTIFLGHILCSQTNLLCLVLTQSLQLSASARVAYLFFILFWVAWDADAWRRGHWEAFQKPPSPRVGLPRGTVLCGASLKGTAARSHMYFSFHSDRSLLLRF